MLDIQHAYEAEKKECNDLLCSLDWKHAEIIKNLAEIKCPDCNSDLIRPGRDNDEYPYFELSCSACGMFFCFSKILSDLLHKHIFFADAYMAMTDGGEYPIEECDSCGEEFFSIDDNKCFNCDYVRKYYKCYQCGEDMGTVNENDIEPPRICDRCDYYEFMKTKD